MLKIFLLALLTLLGPGRTGAHYLKQGENEL